ncbi:MAG: MFS transporter, partial [Turicibacter sp.]
MKLYNKNFFLLWQGQLVSVFGDAIYSIALGFWVLQETGSTAIMGLMMALVNVPIIILGPMSGVIVDRSDRKKLIIIGDVIRGIGMLLIAGAAIFGVLEVWMVMLMGIVLGICSSFFNPSISSVLPDIVPKENLVKANSSYSMATTGASIIGQSIGGFIYAMLGAPIMFLVNGISYLFSAFTELFIDVPKVERKNINLTFKEDFLEGLKFIITFEGLVRTIIVSVFINFLFGMIRVLIIPWFLSNPDLGMAKYGILGGFQSIGIILGTVVLSFITIETKHKYFAYLFSIIIFISGVCLAATFNHFVFILLFFVIAYCFQFIFNTLARSAIMLMTPQDKRGKVMATIVTLAMLFSPLGNLLGGVLGEFIEPRFVIILNSI